MFAGQQPDPILAQVLPLADDARQHVGGAQSGDAKPRDIASRSISYRDAVRFPWLMAVLGVVLLGWIGFVGILMLRPLAAPEAPAALPRLASSALPPLASPAPSGVEDASNSANPTAEPEPLSGSEAKPFNADAWRQASLEAVPPPASIMNPAPGNVPLPPSRDAAGNNEAAPLPPPRPLDFGPIARPATGYDRWTAIYDISAHSVYLPDGTRLEAHSGLGDNRDDPRHVDERDRGATPPHLYELTQRESLFHGVQALRLTPIGDGDVFGRTGLLAHPYMLGMNGDSNGCVSFRDYEVFLRAFQNGAVKRLAVVAQSTREPRPPGRLESLRRDLDP